MKRIRGIFWVVASALLALYGASAAAQAVQEECSPPPQGGDCNYPNAQPLVLGADGTMSVKGVIGVSEFWKLAQNDVDLYSFYALAGKALIIDIDGGIKSTTLLGRSVDTSLSLLGPGPDYLVQHQALTCLSGADAGSVNAKDPCILFTAQAEGVYIVAVTGAPALVYDGGRIDWGVVTSSNRDYINGAYTLIVTGALEIPSLVYMNIEIKPGSRTFAPPQAKGNIAVALLSSGDFDALKADQRSLTFGATGDEQSLKKCAPEGRDVNGDGRLDLVCHFDIEMAKFGPDHLGGVLKGMIGEKHFEGRGLLKVVPAKK